MNLNITKQVTWMRLTAERTAHKRTRETDKCGGFSKCPALTWDTQPLARNPTM